MLPESTDGRLVSGFAALLLPHGLANKLGLISVGGGRGLWWFADLDTVLFDGLVVLTAVFFVILTIPFARFTDRLIKERERRERAQLV